MKDGGASFRAIAEELHIPPSKARRLFEKWSPWMAEGDTIDDPGPAQTPEIVREPEEWEEGEFERPVWLDHERQSESVDQPEPPPTKSELDVKRISFAAGLQPLTIYDLETEVNRYGVKLYIAERHSNGKPRVWFTVDKTGEVTKWVDRFVGNIGTRLGKRIYVHDDLFGRRLE
jgi:hypothetical protein